MSLVILTKPQMKSSTSFILIGKFYRESSNRMDLIEKIISKLKFLISIKQLKYLNKTRLVWFGLVDAFHRKESGYP